MRNDIIDLFTDIDDDLIANAMPEARRPVEVRADTRRFSWGKFAAAAACLAVVVVGGMFALKAVSDRGGLVSSENSADPSGSTLTKTADYPEDAKYQYTGDFSELELCPYVLIDREPYRSFDQLVEKSDLIVVGTFTDDARQNRPTDRLTHQSSWGGSFNKFRIEKVFLGEAEVGSEIVILDHYFVTNGKLMYVSGDSLTPMIKGEQWVYFLGKVTPEYGNYYFPVSIEGRYPVPGNENTFVLRESHYNENIYADVKKMLEAASADHPTDYPEEAKYQYTGDFSELELRNYAEVDRMAYYSFDELVENSDIVVAGTFVDDARQDCPTDNWTYDPSYGASYNKLRIDRVFCGDVEIGSEIVIRDDTFVTNGKLMYIESSTLTPMIKGEQWVYFLRKQSPEYGDYYQPLFTEGRYPVPGKENTFVLTGSQHGVFEERYFHEDIYEDVKKMLGYVDGAEKIERVDWTADKEFIMPEFPEDKFIWKKEEMLVSHNGETASALYGAPGIVSVYLTDINDDGKRELVNLCWNGASGLTADQLMVYDYANSKLYTLKYDKTTLITNELEIRDNVLYVLTYPILDHSEAISSEPLTFDMLTPLTRCGLDDPKFNDKTSPHSESNHVEKISEYFTANKEFIMPEFPEDRFVLNEKEVLVSHGGETASALYGAPGIMSLHLADLNGDGKRELVSVCWEDLSGYVIVYDHENSMLYPPLRPEAMRSYNIEIRDNELCLVTQTNVSYSDLFYEPLTLDMFKPDTGSDPDNVKRIDNSDWTETKEFTIPEFPEDKFIWKENKLSVLRDGAQTANVLYECINIPDVYLADLNGDGKRELISLCKDKASELREYQIIVYDNANLRSYTMRSDAAHSYMLAIRDNELNVVTMNTDDYKVISYEPLTLDMLKAR